MRKKALPVLALFLIVALIAGAIPMAFAEPVERIMIEYMPGKGAMVRNAVVAAGGQIHHELARINTIAVSVTGRWANRLAKDPNVVSIEADPLRYLAADPVPDGDPYLEEVMPWGIEAVQAPAVWDEGYLGEGVTVCVIDTGLYATHEDLVDLPSIGGYSQVDNQWDFDGYGHGTHVVGTITAVGYNDIGVIGVSPGKVAIFMVKIFDNDGAWVNKAHASDLIEAAFICADNGANIISMSLSGTNKSGKERMAFEDLYAQGILSVAAASNDGIEEYHYPASYDSVISVAAIDESLAYADFSQFNDQVELAAPGVDVLSTLSYKSTVGLTVDDVAYDANHVEYAAYGRATGELVDGELCTSGGDWAGMVVLCERGEISFYDKVMNVQNSGGVAAVIYNNVPETLNATLGDGNSSTILAISISQEDGQYLVANELGTAAYVVSEVEVPGSGYEAWAGTSMATPHVSGVAALLWSANPEFTNVQIREAMDMTAFDLGDPGRDVHYGYGLVQAHDALGYLMDLKPGQGPKGPNK
jgi:serine protease